jgi:hypothetical protein
MKPREQYREVSVTLPEAIELFKDHRKISMRDSSEALGGWGALDGPKGAKPF